MSRFTKLAFRILIVVLLAGFLGATLVRISPGFGIDEEELDSRLNSASIQALRQKDAEAGNLPTFYIHYLDRLLHGDLGTSRTLQVPVSRLIAERFPETAKSVGLGLLLAWTAGLSLAVLVVLSRSWYLDLLSGLFSAILLCLPAAVLALLFVLTQAPARLLLAIVLFPKIFCYSRNLLARSALQSHVITAQAKGLGSFRIMFWHILPVAGPQLVALAGVSLSLAFTAAIPIEAICDLPGIGQLAWKAALGRDVALLVNLTGIVTIITLIGNSFSELIGVAPVREAA